VAASAGGAPDTSSAGIGGIVVPLGVQPGSDASAAPLAGTPNLTYHGGPVMHTNTTYAIYDLPAGSTMSASYQTLLNQFLTDVGVASGSTTNVYSTDTQYYDGSGPIAYSSAFGGAFVDTTHPIPDHCSSQYAAKHYTVTGCLLDTDIQAEISYAVSQNPAWVTGPTAEFFVFTPLNVGSCIGTSGGTCAYTAYCGYHSQFTDGSGHVLIYANEPYSDSSAVAGGQVCDSGEHPNGDFADATINVVSHRPFAQRLVRLDR
jgi:hypothetical protein